MLDGSQAIVVDTIIEVHTHRLIDDLRQDMWTDFQPFGLTFVFQNVSGHAGGITLVLD